MRVEVQTPVANTARAVQLQGLFDLPPERLSRVSWDVELPLDEKPWSIGLITGPSGSGKSTIARHVWGADTSAWTWPEDEPVIDGFPQATSIRDITGLLSSVGFASPPAWLRPYHVLSTGERFRADIARTISEAAAHEDVIVVDEFTSVVDRTVAQVGSAAIAKTIRRLGRQFVAVTCHEDVTDWLQPEWVLYPATGEFTWRSLQRRPPIDLTLERAPKELWRLFAPHHYLSETLRSSARLIVAYHDDEPVGCYAYARFVHRSVRNCWESSRVVVLPDWQGVGIASALLNEAGAAARAVGSRVILTAAHPAMVHALARAPNWLMTQKPRFQPREPRLTKNDPHPTKAIRTTSSGRLTASFEYVGPARESDLCEHFRIYDLRRRPRALASA